MMASFSKMVALLSLVLLAGNAQCVTACALEHYRPAKAQPTHCHHKKLPDKEHPTSAPCSHDITIVESSAKAITADSDQAFPATYCVSLVAEADVHCLGTRVEADISPSTPPLSLISVLRI